MSSAPAETSAVTQGHTQPTQYRSVGIILAVSSGVLIGSSFVFKKKGLIRSQKDGPAGEGVGYLKSPLWWTGMTMMILGELCNFGAYAFVEAIIVTPLGALSVVICAILSSIFLNERLTFFGWIGCIQCILGSIVIALNAPEEQSVTTIEGFKHLFLAPGFLSFGSVVIAAALVIIFFVAPKYGKKSMLWYILVCSLIGGLSVSCTQGLGASIVTSIRGDNQFKNWFIYFLLIFVVITLLTEIYYLNVALALFNTAMVTPTYYVIFTFCTLVTSVILYQGLKASVVQILTVVLGFLMICTGITILQMSKVDPRKLKNLDRRTTLLLAAARQEVEPTPRLRRRHAPTEHGEQYDPEKADDDVVSIAETEEPGMDALRGGFGTVGTIVRARRRNTIVSDRTRRGSQASSDAGQAGIGTKRFRNEPPLPPDSAARIEAAKQTPYGPSLQSGPADLRDEPAVRMMMDSPDSQRTGVHFQEQTQASVAQPKGSFDGSRTATPDPYAPGKYVLRVPAPAGSVSAVPRRVTSPPLSRSTTPTRKGSSRVDDGDARRVPRLSVASANSIRVQPAQSEYFSPIVPQEDEDDGESRYDDAVGGLAPPLPRGASSGVVPSDRATIADSFWMPSPEEEDGGVGAGEVKTGRGVIEQPGVTAASEGGSESVASSGHALLNKTR